MPNQNQTKIEDLTAASWGGLSLCVGQGFSGSGNRQFLGDVISYMAKNWYTGYLGCAEPKYFISFFVSINCSKNRFRA